MNYSFKCSVPDCPHLTEVEANSDEEAVEKIMEKQKSHATEAHSEMEALPYDQMKDMVANSMEKKENEVASSG